MNHVYRVIWNRSAACWQAVSETARGQSKSSKSTTTLLKPLLVAASMAVSGIAVAAPTGGAVTSGTASIGVSGSTTTINQSTAKAIINWNDFSIASGETVNFVQPDANAIALNRVVTATPSSILGNLNANGQVFIVNPNGITFGSTAQVNVGGLVASTLDISDSDFNNGTYRFANSSNNASITNQGAISVANSGTAALIAPSIQQAGSIVNNDGSILLTAASDVTLSLTNRVLNSQTINAGHNSATINHSAGTIQADGGKVILTAQGVNSSSTASISSAGSIRAQTLSGNDRGAIDLIADSASGTVNLTGTLDASAPTNGFGGTIRTIGADVAVANSASVTTRKVNQTNLPGTSSYWLIRANSINVGSGGTISGSELSSSLNDGSVTLSAAGTASNQGTLNINDAVSSNSNVIFGLAANKDINFNNNVGLTANLGRLVMSYGSSNDYNLNNNSKITLSGAGATLRLNSTDYTIINSLGVAGDTSTTTLQGMKNNLTGNYALGSDIDASATSGWNSGKGFDPIGNYGSYLTIYEDVNLPGGIGVIQGTIDNPFSGQFHGLGHTVNSLYINRVDTYPTSIPDVLPATFNFNSVGLFGATNNKIRDIGILGGSITGLSNVGGLIGIQKAGVVSNSFSSALVQGLSNVGGLIGQSGLRNDSTGSIISSGEIIHSHTTGNISIGSSVANSSGSSVGGLVGQSYSLVRDSYSTADISVLGDATLTNVGGLIGNSNDASIFNSYATGNLSGKMINAGGLIGGFSVKNTSQQIYQSYATGNINAYRTAGGLVGYMGGSDFYSVAAATIDQSFATGDVETLSTESYNATGGLVGSVYYNSRIKNSHATGDVTGTVKTGGLIGAMSFSNAAIGNFGLVENSYATGSVEGTESVGGLIGQSDSVNTIKNSYSINSGVLGSINVGGLVGLNSSNISNSYSTADVEGINYVGGLVGRAGGTGDDSGNLSGIIRSSYAEGNVVGQSYVGGLAGSAGQMKVIDSYAKGNVTGDSHVGGLLGSLNGYYYTSGGYLYGWLGNVENSYSSNTVNGTASVGGLIGSTNGSATVSNSYWDTTTSGQSASAGGTGKTTAELKQIATFTGWEIADVSNTTSNSTWVIDEDNATPWLR